MQGQSLKSHVASTSTNLTRKINETAYYYVCTTKWVNFHCQINCMWIAKCEIWEGGKGQATISANPTFSDAIFIRVR